jgi:SAM-dependent methyltransferase
MSAPLSTAVERGWIINEPGEDGIIEYLDPLDIEISYPKDMYEQYNTETDAGYWVIHRSNEILRQLKQFGISQLVEVGAGTGSVCGFLYKNGIEITAIEPLKAGAKSIQKKGVQTICGRLEIVNFPPESINAYGVFDVLEHIENPSQLLDEMYRTLKPGGYLLATVPCGQWLWGELDKSLGHYRRYSKRTINEVVSRSGFTPIKSRYLFFTLVLPAFIFRAIPFRLGIQRSEQQVFETIQSEQSSNLVVNAIMKFIFSLEALFSIAIPLPYGLTVLAVYQKNKIQKDLSTCF